MVPDRPTDTDASLVVLAAGRGTRFGGLKQLVAVRDDGAMITDVLIERAAHVGITHVVVVVSEETETLMRDHLTARGTVAFVVRQAGARGTAEALATARAVTSGPVVVLNADDLYPPQAFTLAASHLASAPVPGHAVIGFEVAKTLYGTRPQSRALLEVADGRLIGIREGRVSQDPDLTFTAASAQPDPAAVAERLGGTELVSMNAMVLERDIFDRLDDALTETPSGSPEVYLPDVLAGIVAEGVRVRVLACGEPCHGLTYPEDVSTLATLL